MILFQYLGSLSLMRLLYVPEFYGEFLRGFAWSALVLPVTNDPDDMWSRNPHFLSDDAVTFPNVTVAEVGSGRLSLGGLKFTSDTTAAQRQLSLPIPWLGQLQLWLLLSSPLALMVLVACVTPLVAVALGRCTCFLCCQSCPRGHRPGHMRRVWWHSCQFFSSCTTVYRFLEIMEASQREEGRAKRSRSSIHLVPSSVAVYVAPSNTNARARACVCTVFFFSFFFFLQLPPPCLASVVVVCTPRRVCGCGTGLNSPPSLPSFDAMQCNAMQCHTGMNNSQRVARRLCTA